MKFFLILAILCISLGVSTAQEHTDLSFELQVYPTGVIPGVRLSKSITDRSSVLVRVGYNWFRHRDLGVHDDERGGGLGGSLGYVRYFKDSHQHWQIGIKSDIWFNKVDWSDEGVGSMNEPTFGETSIVVLQPTAELGYTFQTEQGLIITPSLAFGYEWNVKTTGEPTGQGAIVLVGIQVGKRF